MLKKEIMVTNLQELQVCPCTLHYLQFEKQQFYDETVRLKRNLQ